MKDVPATAIFRMIRTKDSVFIEHLQRIFSGDGGKDEVTAISWRLDGTDIVKEMEASPVDTHLFVRVKGRRMLEKRFLAPAGYSGEKHDYAFKVETVIWRKSEEELSNEITLLEDELWDAYVRSIADEGATAMVETWVEDQKRAENLGWGITDRQYNPSVLPFENVVDSFRRIGKLQDEIAKKAGGIPEAAAWLRLQKEWGHMPGCPVNGDADQAREQRAKENIEARRRMAENGLKARLKGGLVIPPDAAGEFLKATDPTMGQALARAAGECGQTQLAAELVLAICALPQADVSWKNATLSAMKQLVSDDAAFFESWPDGLCAKFPGRLRDAVIEWAKGHLIYSRNAIAVLEALRKAKPSVAYDPGVDGIIQELRKK